MENIPTIIYNKYYMSLMISIMQWYGSIKEKVNTRHRIGKVNRVLAVAVVKRYVDKGPITF